MIRILLQNIFIELGKNTSKKETIMLSKQAKRLVNNIMSRKKDRKLAKSNKTCFANRHFSKTASTMDYF